MRERSSTCLLGPLGVSLALHVLLGLVAWGLEGLQSLDRLACEEGALPVEETMRDGTMFFSSSNSVATSRVQAPTPGAVENEETAPFTARVNDVRTTDLTAGKPAFVPDGQGESTAPSLTSPGTAARGSPPKAAVFFGVSVTGRRIVYVIDRSLSMGLNGTFNRAREEVTDSLRSLPLDALFQVVPYNRHAEPLRVNSSTDLLIAEPANVSEVKRRIDDMRAEGGTDHLRALKEAIHLKPDAIFVVTDADGLTQEAVDAATRINVGKAAIHCIELANGSDDGGSPAFRRLAQANGGTYRLVDLNHKPDERSPK